MARKTGKAAAAGGDIPALGAVKSFGCQLQDLDVDSACGAPFDLMIVDYSTDGTDEGTLSPGEVARLQKKPDGSRRIVVGYMSTGEAESYRYYWGADWAKTPPAFVVAKNPDWPENYAVRYWDESWQAILMGSAKAYLDRLITAGFDGVYLDKCDVFEDLATRYPNVAAERQDLEADMVALIAKLSAYAKARKPGFIVVVPNAEGLLTDATAKAAIDAVAKEELVFGIEGPQEPNSKEDFAEAKRGLAAAARAGKPVFVFEYLDDPAKIAQAQQAVSSLGYLLYVSDSSGGLSVLSYA
jgi:cysteinyl-tRNA synthetase, unknown class